MSENSVGSKIVSFIRSHVFFLASFGMMVLLFIIGFVVKNTAVTRYNVALEQLNVINNDIEQSTINTTHKVKYVTKELKGGLSSQRWADDDAIMSDWIYPAFNFENSQEYNKNREIFINRLGANDDFLQVIMPQYTASYASMKNENGSIDDGTNINLHMDSFTSYVDYVKDDVYAYLAVVKCSSTSRFGNSGSSDVILTYKINGKGNILDFHAYTLM